MPRPFPRLSQMLDDAFVASARETARRHGRRSALMRIGSFLVGGAAVAALPFDRSYGAEASERKGPNDDRGCDYWRYCAIDGLLCSTAGGTVKSCPAGSEASQVAWVGTCHNPNDGRDYLISYNDCCGKTPSAAAQFCFNSKGERPGYSMGLHNDINWCMANANKGYHCTVAVVLGEAS